MLGIPTWLWVLGAIMLGNEGAVLPFGQSDNSDENSLADDQANGATQDPDKPKKEPDKPATTKQKKVP